MPIFNTIAMAICALALAISAGAAEKQIPISDFVESAQFAIPRISPDGKYVAVRVTLSESDKDAYLLTVYSLPDMKPVSSVRMPAFEIPVNFHWVSNSRIIVQKGVFFSFLEEPLWTGEIIATDIDGKRQEYLFGREMFMRSKRGATTGDDYGIGYVHFLPSPPNGHFQVREVKWNDQSNNTHLYDVDALTAARKLVTEINMPGAGILSQHDGTPRFAYGSDEKNENIVMRYDSADNQWKAVDIKSTGTSYRPRSFTRDNSEFFATISEKGGPRFVVRESMTSGKRVTIATDPKGDLSYFQYGPPPGVAFGASSMVGIPKVTYFDPESPDAKLHQSLVNSFPGQYVSLTDFSEDGTKLIFFVESDRNPGDYYLMDRKTGSADLLLSSRPKIDPNLMAERRPIEFQSREGKTLTGYLTFPPKRGEKKLPMVLIPHGGPFGPMDTWFYDRDAQFLASRGYAVLQVNFRGSGGRGIAFQKSGYRQWGSGIQDDLIDGVRWATTKGIADPDRACIFGASFGGYSALMAVIREPDLFKCAVGYAGVYDLPSILTEYKTRRNKRRFNYFTESLGDDTQKLESYSPASQAEKIKVPIFLAHGKEDDIALPSQAELMRNALDKAGKPYEWMMVPQEGHGFYAAKNRIAFYEKLEAFLAKYIGPK